VGELVRTVAGWAIDHQTGLALEGLTFVPLQPSQTKKHPEYQKRREAVDDHRHELNGANPAVIEDPRVMRRLLVNLLNANPGAFPMALRAPIVEAIEGLEFGESSPIFAPIKAGRKAGLRERKMHLRAIAFIAYRRAKGVLKGRAEEDVAKAFGQSSDTIISWGKRLRDTFNDLEVSRVITFAENHANSRTAAGEKMYGDQALNAAGAKFRQLKKG
jgi:hypothetical protein